MNRKITLLLSLFLLGCLSSKGQAPITGVDTMCTTTFTVLSDADPGGTWSSSNTLVGSIDPLTGVITAGGTAGTTVITYATSTTSVTTTVTAFGPPPAVTGPSVVCVGSTIALTDAYPLGGTWTSASTGVATVNPATGVVTGVAPGTGLVITFHSTCGNVDYSINVLEMTTVITGTTTLCAGGSITLSDATPGGTWTSSNSSITVSGSGTVTATGAGAAVISYSNGCGTATFTVTAYGPGPAITGPSIVCVGSTISLTDTYPLGGTWSSSSSGVASVDPATGVVTGISPGTAVVITFHPPCGGDIYTTIDVLPVTDVITGTTTVCTNSSINLSDATPGGTWTSSNSTTAFVTGTGNVSGINPGNAVITYSNGCGSATFTVTVLQTPSSISGLNTICQGSSGVFVSTPAGGTWSSSDPVMAPINPTTGVIPPSTGIGFGTACITYTATNGCFSTLCLIIGDCPPCPVNSDFELGSYSNWFYYHNNGASAGTPIAPPTIFAGVPPGAAYRPCVFALTGLSAAVVPPAEITGVDPAGGFPVVGAGVFSLRLGSNKTLYWAAKAVYYVHVPATATNYSLIYRFAVVLEDPGHSPLQEPKFTAKAYDLPPGTVDTATNTTLPVTCAQYDYSAEAVGSFPDFTSTTGTAVFSGAWNRTTCGAATTTTRIYVKPWATTSINLAGLGGHTIRMEFASGDCGQGGHYGYGYVDMTCGTFAIASIGCGDSIATVSAPSGFANYSWYDSTTFGTLYGTTQTVTFPTPTAATTYAVIMTPYTGFGCPDTLYTTIRPSNLQLHVASDTSICVGQTATLSSGATDIALPLSYVWSPTTGLTCPTCATPTTTPFAGVTVYTVSVTDAAGCNKIATQKILADSVAGVTTVAATSCFGFTDGTATVTPTSGNGIYSYTWGTVPAQTTSVATGLAAGIYTVSITDGLGCAGSTAATIVQPPPLTMAIGGTTNPTTCGGSEGSITLTGAFTPGGTYTIRYLFTATGTTTTVAVTTAPPIVADGAGNVILTGLAKGSYDSIAVITSGCPYNILGPIVLVDPPNPALPYVSSNSPICVLTDLHLVTTDVTPGVTYTWAGPGGFTSTVQTPTITSAPFADSGWYVVTVMVNNCFSKDSTFVHIKPNPFDTAIFKQKICSGDTLRLYGRTDIGADAWLWNGPGSYISNFQNPIIPNASASAAGIYTLTVTYHGCTGTDTAEVTVNPTPDPPIVTDTNYCQYDFPSLFLAPALTAVGTNLTWYTTPTGGVPLPGAPQPSTQTNGITTWYVTQTTATDPPCTSLRAPISVGIYQLPDPKFVITDSVFCEGTYFTFEATNVNTGPDFQGVTWYFGTADSTINTNPIVHAFNTPGPTTVTANVYYRVCPDATMKHDIMIYPYPVVNLGLDTSICPGSEALIIGDILNASTPGASWLWNTGETTPNITVVAPGTFYTKVTVNGCSTTDTIEVRNDCYMNIPNVFSPNGDGVNDYFYPRQYLTKGLTSFSMNIYNRWGQEVFTTNSIDGRGWDGTYNDVPQPEGVFIYVIDATFKDGQKEHHQGNITLMR